MSSPTTLSYEVERNRSAPLDDADPQRARVLKRKVADRITDVRRHLDALRAAMARFGEDFDLVEFRTAYGSHDPDELNQVKAVERGVDQLFNYVADLAALGLELAQVRDRHDETNARRDLMRLAEIGVLPRTRAERLDRLRGLRRMLVHEYATATGEQVHEAARIVVTELPDFQRRYVAWIKRGFSAG